MENKYKRILQFFEDYVETYSEFGQNEQTIKKMNTFYDPDLSFPDDGVSGRDEWYQRCLNHPDVKDKLSIEQLIIDETTNQVGAILKTQATDSWSGKILMELRMNATYKLRINDDGDIRITTVRIFLESNPEKVARLAQLYRIGM